MKIKYIFVIFMSISFSNSFTINKEPTFEATLAFAGDVSFAKPILSGNGTSCNYEDIFKQVASIFYSSDYSIVNLESPIVARKNKDKLMFPEKYIHLQSWKESVEALTFGNIDAVTLANNHIFDFGETSIDYTKNVLKRAGIEFFGLSDGSGNTSRQVALVKKINGIRVGFLAYCGTGECVKYRQYLTKGPPLPREDLVKKDIEKIKRDVDIIVVFMHWGREYLPLPDYSEIKLAKLFSKLGVHLVVSSHPHVLRGHEWINNTLVHYSLGNFVYHPHYVMLVGLKRSLEIKLHNRDRMLNRMYSAQSPLSQSEIFQVKINKRGIVNAKYLPIKIVGDKRNCLYPVPISNEWIDVCSEEDTHCYCPRLLNT